MRDRDEDEWTPVRRMMEYRLDPRELSPGGADLRAAIKDKDRALVLKRELAEQFAKNDQTPLMFFDGPRGSAVISGRNGVAMKVLGREIATGKQRIAIFYGAMHMSDLQMRLRRELGLVPIGTRWLVAWDLRSLSGARSTTPSGTTGPSR